MGIQLYHTPCVGVGDENEMKLTITDRVNIRTALLYRMREIRELILSIGSYIKKSTRVRYIQLIRAYAVEYRELHSAYGKVGVWNE